jgi:hypothetical protein
VHSTSLTLTVSGVTDTTSPSITITSPTTASTYATTLSSITLGGTASDNIGVTSVSWNNTTTGANGSTSGTTSWTTPSITLASGSNNITLTAFDAAGLSGTDTITVTYTPPASSSFSQSDRIQTNTSGSTVNIRSCASTSCSILGTQSDRSLGTITSASPTTADGFTWHNVDFTTGSDGYVAEDFLVFAGDLNRDNTVNSLDWSSMNSAWFTSDTTADINKDGLVNSIDFGILNKNWGSSSS